MRLLQKKSDVDTGIGSVMYEAQEAVYTLTGQKILEVSAADKLSEHLPAGVYIKGNQKVLVK